MSVATGPRPSRRPWHAFTWLDHFAIVSYLVEPERLDALLPRGVVAERFVVGATPTSVVSAVSGHDRGFRFRGLPWPTMSGGQVDYRTYVHSGGETGVWFFGASLDSALATVARGLWSMPWHHDQVAVDARWEANTLVEMHLRAGGRWGDAELDLIEPDADDPPHDPLAALPAVTDPLVGWYPRGVDIGRYQVWHPPLELRPAVVTRARHEVFERLALIETRQPPVSALVQRSVALDVQTPPRRWRVGRADGDRRGTSGVGRGRRVIAMGDAGEIQRSYGEDPT